eukprot:g31362.t1
MRCALKGYPDLSGGNQIAHREPGWFDGHNLYWEPTQSFPGHEGEPGSAFDEAVGIPKEGQLPAGPWVRITSAMEPGGIPGPDSGLWTLQTAFYSECYGPLPLEFLEKLGEFQAGPGARELYLRTRRDAMKEDFVEMKVPAEEEPDDWDESSNDEDFSLEALGLVEAIPRQSVAFEERGDGVTKKPWVSSGGPGSWANKGVERKDPGRRPRMCDECPVCVSIFASKCCEVLPKK